MKHAEGSSDKYKDDATEGDRNIFYDFDLELELSPFTCALVMVRLRQVRNAMHGYAWRLLLQDTLLRLVSLR